MADQAANPCCALHPPPPPPSLPCRSQQVVDFVRERLGRGTRPADVAAELLSACLARDPREARGVGCDNMTAAVRCVRGGVWVAA